VTVEPKVMQVLLLLVRRKGEVVSREEILSEIWPDTIVGEEVVWRSISQLRKAIGDDASNPAYVETIPRKGYRWIPQTAGGTAPEERTPPPRARISQRRWFVAPVAVLALVAGWRILAPDRPKASDTEPIWVLVTDVAGDAGPEYGQAVRHGLEVALAGSQQVRVVPRERIFSVLELMRLSPDATLTPELAREIAFRDGRIGKIVASDIDRVGEQFLLHMRLLDPSSGETVSAREVSAPPSSVIESLQELSDWIHRTLGESVGLLGSYRGSLEQATTGSLDALKAYSEGMKFSYGWNWGPAERLFRLALEKDPDFSSAHIMLAWAIRNQIPERERKYASERFRNPAREALRLSARLPDRERLWIEGSYYSLTEDHQRAAAAYEALVARFPDHYWANHNLGSIYLSYSRHAGDPNAAVQRAKFLLGARSDLNPQNLDFALETVESLTDFGSIAEAGPYLTRVRSILNLRQEAGLPRMLGAELYLEIHPLIRAFEENGTLDVLAANFEMLEKKYGARPIWLGAIALDLGKLDRARYWYELVQDGAQRDRLLLDVAYVAGRVDFQAALNSYASRYSIDQVATDDLVPFLLAGGRLEEASSALENLPLAPWTRLDVKNAGAGLLLRMQGNVSQGEELLHGAIACPLRYPPFIVAATVYADLLTSEQRLGEATEVLRRALRKRPVLTSGLALQWPAVIRLLELYHRQGRMREREELKREASALLRCADPDHPALLALDPAGN